MIKPFHELTKVEYEALVKEGITYGELSKRHPQPDWCKYPDATEGAMGCWSLMYFYIKDRDYCKDCDLSIDYKEPPCSTGGK